MNLMRLVRALQVMFYSLRIGQMLGVPRVVRAVSGYLAHRRLVLFWMVALAAFAVPWGWHLFPGMGTTAQAGDGDLCRVLRVVDGDGVRLDCGPGRENLNVRLYCIDAPETEQEPWGDRSTEHLEGLIGPTVRLIDHGRGRWGRVIGQISTPDGVDLNRRMVADGWAPVYPAYCDNLRYHEAEQEARKAGLGVWAQPGEYQAPWMWRREQR